MTIVDIDYYKNDFLGKADGVSDEELLYNIKRSEDLFHVITQYRVLDSSQALINHPRMQKSIKDAICIMCEDMLLNGEDNGDMTSVSVDGFSYTLTSDNKPNSIRIPKLAYGILSQTGLLYRGIRSC